MKKLNTINLGENEYPIKCDLDALEQLQDEFGSLQNFEFLLKGMNPILDENGQKKIDKNGDIEVEMTEPSMKAIKTALLIMIKEGVEIHNEDATEKIKLPSDKKLCRMIEAPFTISVKLYEEYLNSLMTKNPETLDTE